MQIDDEQDEEHGSYIIINIARLSVSNMECLHYEARVPRSKIEVRTNQYSPFKGEDIGIFGLTQN